MSFSHQLTTTFEHASAALTKTETVTADAEDNRDIAVPDSSTDLQVAISIDFSAMKSLFLLSDQDMTLETNNGATPADTLNLKANVPVVWTENSVFANPFTVDVTDFFLTNTSGSAATLNVRVLQDSTP